MGKKPNRLNHDALSGFTLFEVVVAIIVIAVIVMVFYSLRHVDEVARMQSLIRELDQIEAAITVFDVKYQALPGDFNRENPDFLKSLGKGNGDSDIDPERESLLAWLHLQRAEVIDESELEPIVKNNRPLRVPIPGVAVDHAGFRVYKPAEPIHGQSGNMLHFGRESGEPLLKDGILTPDEAVFIDSKIDDGTTTEGKLLVDGPDGSDCLTESTDTIELFLPAPAECLLHLLLLSR